MYLISSSNMCFSLSLKFHEMGTFHPWRHFARSTLQILILLRCLLTKFLSLSTHAEVTKKAQSKSRWSLPKAVNRERITHFPP